MRVELRREEVAEVRLVPDPVEADERVAGVPAGVARGERAGVVRDVGQPNTRRAAVDGRGERLGTFAPGAGTKRG